MGEKNARQNQTLWGEIAGFSPSGLASALKRTRTCPVNTFIGESKVPAGAPAGGRQLSKQATRARILEVAKAQLEESGFEATSIRGVARAAGVATGTVLLHCVDKRDLLHAALFEDLQQRWELARDKKGSRSLKRNLSRLAQTFFSYYAERPTLSRALLRESLFAEPPWNARFAAQVADVHRHVATLAEVAKQRGELPSAVDSAVFAASFFSFYYFALLAWLQGGHPAPLRLFETLLAQHLSVSRPRPPTLKAPRK